MTLVESLIKDIRENYGAETAEMVKGVLTVVSAKVKAKNLFGWRAYLDDVLIDLVQYMIDTEFQYSGGSYVVCGIQSSIDHCRYCNAQKRRGNYELILFDGEEFFQIKDENSNKEREQEELISSIKMRFGEALAEALRPYLIGKEAKLKAEVLARIRKPDFKAWFKKYTGK